MTRLGYVLPIRSAAPAPAELAAYLGWLAPRVELVVVDGSPAPVAAVNRAAWEGLGTVLGPDPDLASANGKVAGVLTGLRHCRSDAVIVADDDVRYDAAGLARMARLLGGHEVVRPQNVYRPLSWPARWDTGRILLNRAVGGDYPGTLGVRRSVLMAAGGYDGDVLFENLELIRTVRAAGGREANARDLFVARRPPSARWFLGQRVRQAYDDLALPARMAVWLSIAPAVALSPRPRATAARLALLAVVLAETGRRRDGGRAAFPASTTLAAPLWLAERAVCAWIALGARARGGVRYRGRRLRRSATPVRLLRARAARRAAVPSPGP